MCGISLKLHLFKTTKGDKIKVYLFITLTKFLQLLGDGINPSRPDL